MKFKAFFAWYDFWVGLYYDKKRKILYVNPLPMVVLSFASDQNEWNGSRWEVPINEKYLCRDGCLDFEELGEGACKDCVASWKEHIQSLATRTNKK